MHYARIMISNGYISVANDANGEFIMTFNAEHNKEFSREIENLLALFENDDGGSEIDVDGITLMSRFISLLIKHVYHEEVLMRKSPNDHIAEHIYEHNMIIDELSIALAMQDNETGVDSIKMAKLMRSIFLPHLTKYPPS